MSDATTTKYFLILCILLNFAWVKTSADFFQNHFFYKFLSGIPSVSNSLYPDQVESFVEPDLGQNCSQRLSADETNTQRV